MKFDEGQEISLCDMYDAPAFRGVSIMIYLETEEKVKHAFKVLAEGGNITQELGEVFWSKLYGCVTDKFGVEWQPMVME